MKLMLVIAFVVALAGCGSQRETAGRPPGAAPPPAAAPKPGAPDIVLTVASLDLGRHGKRIERDDLERFAAILRRDTVDVLLLAGVVRYPGVTTRVDIPDELSILTGMRNVFGETMSVSGRQAGNAVFSLYPVTSSENTHFQGADEAALQAIIDCGVGPVVLVSTRLPDRATAADETGAANTLNAFHAYYAGHPVIVGGNLPRDAAMRGVAAYDELHPARGGWDAPRLWYAAGGTAPVAALGARAEETNLGPLVVARFGFYHGR